MKRSNSAPNVAKLLQAVDLKPITIQTNLTKTSLSSSNISLPGELARQPELSPRRQPLSSPLPLSRINSPTSKYRVAQIKKEETLDERDNEREVQEQIQLNKTWDDSMKLHVEDPTDAMMDVWSVSSLPPHPPSAFVSPSSPLTSKMRSRSLTPTSPSSSRTFSYRRSCSPVLRPSSLCFGKRKRDDSEEMDTSPTVPCKKQQLGYASPYSLSPCVSPLTGNSPLHHSFSRKSSTTQSESTPLSSPSSIHTNPFALKYDSGNLGDQWQSLSGSGSACSSTGHSPSVGNTPVNHGISRSAPFSLDELPSTKLIQGLNAHRFNGTHEDNKNAMDTVEVITETPTPLSPKGLQFRQKPFPLSVATLPSPIPRTATNNGAIDSSFNHISSSPNQQSVWLSPSTSPVMRSQPNSPTVIIEGDRNSVETTHRQMFHHHTLQHDRHLSPFNSDVHPPRIIKPAKTRLQKYGFSSKGMIKPEPQRPASVGSMEAYIGRTGGLPAVGHSSNRLGISSPLTKLSMSSNLDGDQERMSPTKSGRTRTPIKRRMSDVSTDSQEDSFMESDDGSVNFEESLPTTKVVRMIS